MSVFCWSNDQSGELLGHWWYIMTIKMSHPANPGLAHIVTSCLWAVYFICVWRCFMYIYKAGHRSIYLQVGQMVIQTLHA